MCRVESSHVLDCNRDKGKKKEAAATSEDVTHHGQVHEHEWKSRDDGQ